MPSPGSMVALSQPVEASVLKGLKIHPENPLRFDFIVDPGSPTESEASFEALAEKPSAKKSRVAQKSTLKAETTKLIKYFLAGLTVPEKDLWVNLSPYEKDRIVPEAFGKTEMGRDLLAQDYLLKQLTASLLYPEGETGKHFWNKVYAEATKRFGSTAGVAVNTFNKVWIMPDKAVVYENAKAGTAYVVESKLRVMLEQDYVATQRSRSGEGAKRIEPEDYLAAGTKGPRRDNPLSTQILREIIIPQLNQEVNQGKNFAPLRQVYHSLILANWYKKKIKDSILAHVYADKSKIEGLLPGNEALNAKATQGAAPLDVDAIYRSYLEAFKKGAYNYIKEDIDPATHKPLPRKYFSGGFAMQLGDAAMFVNDGTIDKTMAARIQNGGDGLSAISVGLDIISQVPSKPNADRAFLTRQDQASISVSDELIKRMGDEKRSILKVRLQRHSEAFPETLKLIEEIKMARIHMAVGTTNPFADIILNKLGIWNDFKFVLTGNDVTREQRKPNPYFYLKTAEGLAKAVGILDGAYVKGLRDIIVFEDSPVGARSALGGNFFVIGVARSDTEEKRLRDVGVEHIWRADREEMTLAKLKEIYAKDPDTQAAIKAVMFDLDGVISNTERDNYFAWKDVFDPYMKELGLSNNEFTWEYYDHHFSGKSSDEIARAFTTVAQIKAIYYRKLLETAARGSDDPNTSDLDGMKKMIDEVLAQGDETTNALMQASFFSSTVDGKSYWIPKVELNPGKDYRNVESTDIFESLKAAMKAHPKFSAASATGRVVVGVAGPSGAGKTEITNNLEKYLAHQTKGKVLVLHTDDYRKPGEDRDKKGLSGVDAIEMEKLVESIRGFKAGAKINVPVFDARERRITGWKTVDTSLYDTVVLEGVYAFLGQDLQDCVDFKIMLTSSPEDRLDAKQERDKDRYPRWRIGRVAARAALEEDPLVLLPQQGAADVLLVRKGSGYDFYEKVSSDEAMSAGGIPILPGIRDDAFRKGGIDMTRAAAEVRSDGAADGAGDGLLVDQAMWAALKNARGLRPVILSVQPLGDLRKYLGMKVMP